MATRTGFVAISIALATYILLVFVEGFLIIDDAAYSLAIDLGFALALPEDTSSSPFLLDERGWIWRDLGNLGMLRQSVIFLVLLANGICLFAIGTALVQRVRDGHRLIRYVPILICLFLLPPFAFPWVSFLGARQRVRGIVGELNNIAAVVKENLDKVTTPNAVAVMLPTLGKTYARSEEAGKFQFGAPGQERTPAAAKSERVGRRLWYFSEDDLLLVDLEGGQYPTAAFYTGTDELAGIIEKYQPGTRVQRLTHLNGSWYLVKSRRVRP